MKSKWIDLKDSAVALRRQGNSIRDIEEKLGIARSTLSWWLRNTAISSEQTKKLNDRAKKSLVKARASAVIWHNKQKADRLKTAEESATLSLEQVDIFNKNIVELALAMLYLGEGTKKTPVTSLGNSDPIILRFFLDSICLLYGLDRNRIRFDLHLRADQNPIEMRKYWAHELEVPLERFVTVSVDKRTVGRPSYQNYKGVCVVHCGNVAIQRKLVYLGRTFCDKFRRISQSAHSSIGRAPH